MHPSLARMSAHHCAMARHMPFLHRPVGRHLLADGTAAPLVGTPEYRAQLLANMQNINSLFTAAKGRLDSAKASIKKGERAPWLALHAEPKPRLRPCPCTSGCSVPERPPPTLSPWGLLTPPHQPGTGGPGPA